MGCGAFLIAVDPSNASRHAMHGKREKVAMFGMPSQRWFDQLLRRTAVDNEEIDRRMREPNDKTLTERVKRLEDILCLEKVIGTPDRGAVSAERELHERYGDESILGSVKEEPAWSARGQYVGPRTAYDEIGSRERFAEREKAQEATVGKRRYHGGLGARAGEMPAQQTALEEIMQRVQHCTDRILGTANRLERIGERVFGPLPENAVGCGDAKVNPDGTLDHTLLALNWLDGAIARLEMAEARLSGI